MDITELQGSTMLKDAPSIINTNFSEVETEIGKKVAATTYNEKMTEIDGSLAELSSGKANDNEVLHLSGGTMSGTLISDCFGNNIPSGIAGKDNNNGISIRGGESMENSSLVLFGQQHATAAGIFKLRANNGTDEKEIVGYPNGALTWGGNNVCYSGKASMPSGTASNITSPYTTQKDGWIFLKGKCTVTNGYVYCSIDGTDNNILSYGPIASYDAYLYIPVKRGTVVLFGSGGATLEVAKFIPAQSEV